MSSRIPRIVLASTSNIRRVLLQRLRIAFDVVPPEYEEEDLGLEPESEALSRATGKAESVIETVGDGIIIGSDQLLVVQGNAIPKPTTENATVHLLRAMKGIRHSLFTALSVFDTRSERWLNDTVVSSLVIRADISDEEILRYVRMDQSIGCAGGYKLESLGICLFSHIDTPDYTAILGMPLISLCDVLRSVGVVIPPLLP